MRSGKEEAESNGRITTRLPLRALSLLLSISIGAMAGACSQQSGKDETASIAGGDNIYIADNGLIYLPNEADAMENGAARELPSAPTTTSAGEVRR